VALRAWSRRLDGFDGPQELSLRELQEGSRTTDPAVRRAIRFAVDRTSRVALGQLPRLTTTYSTPGVRIESRRDPLSRVGCYVPGGRFPLVSSVVLTVVPARIAGVPDITVVCPTITPAICSAALIAGATRLIRMGGAQAIAALAYGTRTVGRVDKIVGPGNAWVSAAKAIIAADCAIDFYAGPSEIVVWSERGNPAWIAADLIAQAEHDADARAVCITANRRLALAVKDAVALQSEGQGTARQSLRRRGGVILAKSRAEAAALVSRFAPEHAVCDTKKDAAMIRHAGTVFVGDWSAQALGDYVTGSNHVLPTRAAARGRGGLSAADFVRVYTVQTVTRSGFKRLSRPAVTLALAEGLKAHADSIRRRLTSKRKRSR
jgi:histidinol dehydrogenase